MAIAGSDGSIILTTQIDTKGINSGLRYMKNAVSKIGKGFAAISAVAAASAIAITKMAVSAYADYEQLVGGIETLFKDSAKKVIDYANDAFYTAGVSANEYMQQVTSFSASLISSLGGDTGKAADVANMALVDISDNVNKMGSSMESVTLAYQSFARQQYILLDNLKLGYGGTKTEMERLLRDAQAITGVKYDISNLSDVYTALHVIQEQLGITGTTTLEAEKTITGSLNMTKAAWQNLITAIAGGGDLDRAINNFVYSLEKFTSNIVPVIERTLIGLGNAIQRILPQLVETVVSALIQSIPSLVAAVYNMIIGLFKGLVAGIKALFTGGTAKATAQLNNTVTGLAAGTNSVAENMNDIAAATEDSGKAAKKAGKEAKKSLAAFDDLQILSEQTSAANSGNANSGGSGLSGFGGGGAGGIQLDIAEGVEENFNFGWLDKLKEKLSEIKNIFMSGFWQGFGNWLDESGNVDFSGITNSIKEIKNSLKEIFQDSGVKTAANNLVNSMALSFGKFAGSVSSIGVTIATNLLGGLNKYLESNSEFIKQRIIGIFDASAGINTAVGNMWTAFANIFSTYANENGQTLTANIIGIFSNAILGIIELATKSGEDFINFLTQPIIANQESLKIVLDGILGYFADITTGIKTFVDGLVEGVLKLYDESISPFIQTLTDVVTEWVGVFTSAWNEHIQPVLDEFAEKFQEVVNEYISPMFEKMFEFIGKLMNEYITPLLENYLKPLGSYLIDTFGNIFAEVFGRIGQLVMDAFKLISGIIGGLFEVFSGIIDFITGVFTGDWKKAWEGLVSIFKGIANVIISIFEGVVNLIINALNTLISGIDIVISNVGSAIGQNWNIPKIPSVSIPRLAQGAVIPPNREFLAVLGDQKRGTNIEAPADLIKQMAMEAIIETGGTGQTTKEEHYYLNETELMSIVYKLVKGGERLRGNSLISEGAY